jgi:putative SOS response-associated peptidase YedK
MINARSESVPEKPAFRAAFKRRRCIVPSSGFYEWKKVEKGKEPIFIAPADDSVFALAGLWETWTGPDGGELQSCTIITTEANDVMTPIHNRMPVILDEAAWAEWLGTGSEDTPAHLSKLPHLFRPYDGKKMKLRPVSTYVNSPRNEGEQCIEPVPA